MCRSDPVAHLATSFVDLVDFEYLRRCQLQDFAVFGHFNSRFASIGVSFFVIVSPLRGNSAAREFVFCVQDPQLRKDSERSYALRKLEMKVKHTHCFIHVLAHHHRFTHSTSGLVLLISGLVWHTRLTPQG